LLVRKTDWHDFDGLKLVLEHGGNPNSMPKFGDNALHHALRRDNHVKIIKLLLDHGADPSLKNDRDGSTATAMAALHGRGEVLALFEARGIALGLEGVDRLIAACAMDNREAIRSLTAEEPRLVKEVVERGGTLLTEFSGVGNVAGIRNLLELGINVAALHKEGDPYFDIARDSTALHVAAWRAWPAAVKELIARGAPVNTLDAKGRTALALAVKACVDSYWIDRRTPESVEALLRAGATVTGIEIPSGYDAIDELLRQYSGTA
jgi:ankyrin repeat protein